MASGILAFKNKFNEPNPKNEKAFIFSLSWAQSMWSFFCEEVGVGYFQDQFVYLFGEKTDQLNTLLEDWSFLFNDNKKRRVIGKNAYGSLLVLEDHDTEATRGKVGVIDTLNVNYFTHDNLTFVSLQSKWLPEGLIPNFLDDKVYKEFKKELPFEMILAPKKPFSLGGTMSMENFQVENIFDYYKTTGEIYKKYFSTKV